MPDQRLAAHQRNMEGLMFAHESHYTFDQRVSAQLVQFAQGDFAAQVSLTVGIATGATERPLKILRQAASNWRGVRLGLGAGESIGRCDASYSAMGASSSMPERMRICEAQKNEGASAVRLFAH